VLIINADDWGRSRPETDRAFECYAKGRITSVTAMVFMADSARAAALAKENHMNVGLHLNLVQPITSPELPRRIAAAQLQISRFLRCWKYAVALYNPFLRKQFRLVYRAQAEEFERLYGKPPSHVDGHQHMHLCANVLLGHVIPKGHRVRRNFSFGPGENGWLNRSYRRLTDSWLRRRYESTDYFFSLAACLRAKNLDHVTGMARTADVELMAHPVNGEEYDWLMSDDHAQVLRNVQTGSYALL
jgi:predicted glycoside hydrolase/deacetylase ChbG (UPF0249 family)